MASRQKQDEPPSNQDPLNVLGYPCPCNLFGNSSVARAVLSAMIDGVRNCPFCTTSRRQTRYGSGIGGDRGTAPASCSASCCARGEQRPTRRRRSGRRGSTSDPDSARRVSAPRAGATRVTRALSSMRLVRWRDDRPGARRSPDMMLIGRRAALARLAACGASSRVEHAEERRDMTARKVSGTGRSFSSEPILPGPARRRAPLSRSHPPHRAPHHHPQP